MRAVFLDRDGVIIEDRGYIRDPNEVALLPGVAAVLGRLAAAGWKLIVISNQSGVGRGLITPVEMHVVQRRVEELLREEGVELTASYFCPHAPDAACECRKPSPYLLLKAAVEHGVDLSQSWMVGDKESDVQAGLAAGCRTILLRTPDHWDEIAL